MINRLLQLLFAPALDRRPAVLHQPPHRLDAVEFRAVGRQEFELDAFLLQECKRGPDGSSVMDGGVVEHDYKRFVDLASQMLHRAQKGLGGAGLPVVGVHDRSAAEQRGHDIEALAVWSIDQVLLAAWRSGAAVGVSLSETGLVEVGQFDLAGLRSAPQLVERLAGVGEGGGLSLFFKLWRVRFHTMPLALRALIRVFTSTGKPCASIWRCSSSVALKGSCRAHCSKRSRQLPRRACAVRRCGALSKNASMPSLAQRCQVTHTVSMLRSCSFATSRLSRGCDSSSKVLARSPARQSGDFLTTCFSASRSSSLSRVSNYLPIQTPHLHDRAHAVEDRTRTHETPKQDHCSKNFNQPTYCSLTSSGLVRKAFSMPRLPSLTQASTSDGVRS